MSPTVTGTSEMAEFGRKFSFKGARPDDNDLHMIVAETESREDAAT
jgi:hypothetical protein